MAIYDNPMAIIMYKIVWVCILNSSQTLWWDTVLPTNVQTAIKLTKLYLLDNSRATTLYKKVWACL